MVAVISSSLSSHASAARLLYAMGRDQSLPKRFFGYIHPRLKPCFNILLIGAFSLTAVVGELEVIYSFISFGALIGFTFVNLSVLRTFSSNKTKRRTEYIEICRDPSMRDCVLHLAVNEHQYKCINHWHDLADYRFCLFLLQAENKT